MALLTTSLLVDLFILVVGLIATLYWLATKNFDYWRKKGVPFIEPTPFMGNIKDTLLGKKNMGEVLAEIYAQAKNSPYIGVFAFHRPMFVLREPNLIKAVLVKDFSTFQDRSFSPDASLDPLFCKNLFGMNGPKWKYLRAKLSPTFTSGKMKIMYDLVNECGKELVNLVDSEISGESSVLEVKEMLARYTTDVIASVGFGLQGNALKDPRAEFRRILRKVFDFSFWKGIKGTAAFFTPQLLTTLRLQVFDQEITTFSRQVVWNTVEHRKTTGYVRKDFLDLLIQLKEKGELDADEPSGDVKTKPTSKSDNTYELDGDDFVAQAFVFMAAGFETSSSTMTFALYELARHPQAQTRLREEVRAALRASGGRLTYEAVHALPYMSQVTNETLRLYPILPFLDRVCLQDYQLPESKLVIEKGTLVVVPVLGIQRDPQYFEDPESFKPERFSEENKGKMASFSYIPFGEGPRICIGMRMGLMQVKVGLAHFLNRFEIRLSDKTSGPMAFDPKTLLLSFDGGLPLRVTKLADAV